MVKRNRMLAIVLLASIGITQIYALNPNRVVLPVATAAAVAGSLAAYNAMNNNGSEIINAPVAIGSVITKNASHEDVQETIISTQSLANNATQVAIEFVSKNRKAITHSIVGFAIGVFLGCLGYKWLINKLSNKQAHAEINATRANLDTITNNQNSDQQIPSTATNLVVVEHHSDQHKNEDSDAINLIDLALFSGLYAVAMNNSEDSIDPESEDGYYHDGE